MNKVDSQGRLAEYSRTWHGIGLLFSIIACGILSLSSTSIEAMNAIRDKLPLPQSVKLANVTAAGLAGMAMAAFGVAAAGLNVDISLGRLYAISQFYLMTASLIVGAFEVAGKLSSFAIAGIAVAAAFTYSLYVGAMISINEFEEEMLR